jgi:protein-disulfide isomerase
MVIKLQQMIAAAAITVWLFFCAGYAAHATKVSVHKELLAVVAGHRIYDSDLPPSAQTQLQQLHYGEYEVKKRAVNDVIDRFFLEIEAKKKGTSEDKLLSDTVDSRVLDPTEAELEAAYTSQKEKTKKPFSEARPQIEQSLRAARVREARAAYLSQLRVEREVVFVLEPPKSETRYDPRRVRGEPGASVLIVEFADFQCPFSRESEQTLKDLLSKYQGRVRLAFRDFPLREIHPLAETAAEAARCAGQQGKFWEYHDLIFQNQNNLSQSSLVEDARSLSLDVKRFDSCLSGSEYRAQVQQDLQDGLDSGVTGTPGLFINGTYFQGSLPPPALEHIVQEELSPGREN